MGKLSAIALTAVVGALIAMQAPLNSVLGKKVGTIQAAVVSFVVGLIALLIITAFSHGDFRQIGQVIHVKWYYLLGGLMGAAYVAAVLVTVRTLGATGVTAATIAGQLVMALVIDQFGLFGVMRNHVSIARIAGVVLLAGGTFLVVRH
jgi:bacterial/archaeal transporter family-2 protein